MTKLLLLLLLLGAAGWWLFGRARTGGEAMSLAEAQHLLGVGPGASAAEIRAAWRQRIAEAHPDRGGSSGMAARLNAARDRALAESSRGQGT